MYDLGSRLKSIRQQRSLTQRELASRVNKSVSAISSYETNAQLPPIDVLESIALTLHVSIDSLVGLDHTNTYTAPHLSSNQNELIELLLQEFRNEKISTEELSPSQVKILQKIVTEFMKP